VIPLRNTFAFVPQGPNHPSRARYPQSTRARGNARPPRTLIADDEPDILIALRILLSNEGHELEAVSSPAAVLETITRSQFDVVLMDLNYARDTTSGREGIDLITRIQALDPLLPIVVMTGWGTVDLAVELMRRGVRDFVQKPWDNSRLLQTLNKQVKHARARRNVQRRLTLAQKTDAQLQRELVEARELQENLLASSSTPIEGLAVAVEWLPATTVGGDYIAAFNIDDEHAALCVADVVGKGLPAALLMANFQAALKSLASQNLSPSEVTTRLNDVLYANIPLHKFITAFYAVVNIPNRTLAFSNAGHNPSLLVRNNGECIRLEAGGSVLGAFPNAPFEQEEIQLRSGDRLLLFTDGLTEATDNSGEQFGEQGLMDLLRDHCHRDASELKELVLSTVTQFCGDNFCDDAALMVIGID
jgi:phosphoserine phosphatase RsbU/P